MLFLLLFFAFLLPLISSAQTPPPRRPITFDDMMHMKRLGETAVSPDGKWLAYSVTAVDLAKNTKTPELWLQAISEPSFQESAPIKLSVAQPGDSDPQFAPDGKRILFISSRTGAPQIWLADFDSATGAATHQHKLTNLDLGIDNAKWSPDGHSIVFTASVYPDCPAIMPNDNGVGAECNYDRAAAAADSKVKAQIWTHLLYRHWNHFTGDQRSHLFLVSVDKGAMRDLNPGDTHDVPPFSLEGSGCGCDLSPDSKELAFTEKKVDDEAMSTNADIFTLDLTDPATKPVKVSTSPGGDFDPAYSPDGKYLAWRSQARAGYESDKFRLVLYDRAAKTIKDLLPDWDNWVDEFAWSPDSKAIFFAGSETGESPVSRANLSGGFVELVTHSDFGDLHPGTDTKSLIATGMTVEAPGEVFVVHLHETAYPHDRDAQLGFSPSLKYLSNPRATEPITHLNDAILAQLDLPKMESFWFTAKDGTKLEGFLIRPPGFDPAQKYPVKFLIHGGPQGAWGDSWSYRWNAELFAANGYVVVMINPRGSTGYGQAIVDGVNGDWGGKPFTDLMTGLDYVEQHYPFIDKSRECALGASYGGYMANWVLGHTNRFKCIVSHDGMFNAESAFGSTEEDWFNIWEFRGHPWDYYGKPDSENPYRKWSPSLYAKNFKTPTLVVHSQLDYRLDVSEGFQLFDTLQMLGVPSKMLYFPDEGHWVLKPQNSQLWYKTVNDWVDQWTGKAATSR